MKRILRTGLPMLLLAASGVAAHEPTDRHHGAHVHGQAAGSLAQDGSQLTLSLVVPGVNLVGFEHAPRDEAQRERLESTLEALESGRWLVFDERGQCRVGTLSVKASGFSRGGGHPDHHHHNDDHPAREHAEFEIEAVIECDRVDRLGSINLDLFGDWPGNDMIALDVLADRRMERVRLTVDDFRIDLAGR